MMYEVRGKDGRNEVLAVGNFEGDAGAEVRARVDSCTNDDSDASNSPNARFPVDTYVDIALVHAADGTASIFWNGSLKARGHVHLPRRVHRNNCYVGRSHWSSDPYFKGEISGLHVFDYALSTSELKGALQRIFPAESRGRPVLSLGDTWSGVDLEKSLMRHLSREKREEYDQQCTLACAFAHRSDELTSSQSCGRIGCGGSGRCSNVGGDPTEPLHYIMDLHLAGSLGQHALSQLCAAIEAHAVQRTSLEDHHRRAVQRGAVREAQQLAEQISDSLDALRRAQAAVRMIRYASRLPTSMRHEASTGQLRQPPRIATAIEPGSGMFQAFAIYELRTGDANCGGRFHVYISDLFNMRSLLPLQTCWRPAVAALLVNLLCNEADSDQQAVVLHAIADTLPGSFTGTASSPTSRLEGYYARIGFTSSTRAFENAGLSESYPAGGSCDSRYLLYLPEQATDAVAGAARCEVVPPVAYGDDLAGGK